MIILPTAFLFIYFLFNTTANAQVEGYVKNYAGQGLEGKIVQVYMTLGNGNIEVGKQTIDFEAKDISSGLYIYKLQCVNFVQNKK